MASRVYFMINNQVATPVKYSFFLLQCCSPQGRLAPCPRGSDSTSPASAQLLEGSKGREKAPSARRRKGRTKQFPADPPGDTLKGGFPSKARHFDLFCWKIPSSSSILNYKNLKMNRLFPSPAITRVQGLPQQSA